MASRKPRLTHIDSCGKARMVDVGAKDVTQREARAESWLLISLDAYDALQAGTVKKGDVPATARLAGIMAAKRTHELIPLCHPLKLTSVQVDAEMVEAKHVSRAVAAQAPGRPAIRIIATVRANDRTGVEMEALTATSVAALTAYDMLKAVDKSAIIACTRLLSKSGGKSGDYVVNATG